MEAQNEVKAAQVAYMSALRTLNEANGKVLEEERMYCLRSCLNQAAEVFESLYGAEVTIRMQLLFLQSLPMFLGSRKALGDAVALVDSVIGILLNFSIC